jgi:hypothetical protein
MSGKYGFIRLRKEPRLMVFERKVLRRIRVFRPKKEKVKGECRILHNEQLHNLFSPAVLLG